MNGKQAKRLRKAAMGLAVALDEAGKNISARGQNVETHTQMDPQSILSNRSRDNAVLVKGKTIHNDELSLRGIYQALKRGVVDGKVKDRVEIVDKL